MTSQLSGIPLAKKRLFVIGLAILIGIAASILYLTTTPSKPVCGNNVCELFETPGECCKDCDCWKQGEVCNVNSNKCETRDIKITDERIRELVVQYFEKQGKEVVSMNITSLITWKNKLGKNVMVQIGGQDSPVPLVVLEDDEVIEFSI